MDIHLIGFIVQIVVLAITIIFGTSYYTKRTSNRDRKKKINKYFWKHGYIREYTGDYVAGADKWCWVRWKDNKIITDEEIEGLSFKQIKERYK